MSFINPTSKASSSPVTLFKENSGFPCRDCHLVFHKKLLLQNHSKLCLNRCVKNAKKQVGSFFSEWTESTGKTFSNTTNEKPKILPLSQPLLSLSQILDFENAGESSEMSLVDWLPTTQSLHSHTTLQ